MFRFRMLQSYDFIYLIRQGVTSLNVYTLICVRADTNSSINTILTNIPEC